MLVVKPNKRRMRQFRDSPAENGLARTPGSGYANGPRWGRGFLAAGIAGVIVLGIIALYLRF
jgi:hypothetical protein